ncbi:MutS family DNA mismatch repair protein [Clostridium sp. D33t1_170424_F3]|uniref:MutS family DNA mismatch repair protein n=1 Tax=Clostridium sp. D33t1_170424_F3 TaxID=2787099 RepID=UPI0018AB86DC|nr:MutS family DNA mismatch repair protein [Clostridium sp. D33t1_170424_F3]MDC0700429.1 mannonate oxidoreductase [Blautia wexlerae]
MGLEYYQAELQKSIEACGALQKKYNRISLLRLFVFLFAVVSFAAGIWMRNVIGYAAGALGFLAFLLLLRVHEKVAREQRREQARRETLERYTGRFDERWKSFPDDGAPYLSEDFPQGRDLDLFGKASLYQLVCIARTKMGRDRLAESLQNIAPDRAEIQRRQGAVKELAEKPAFAVELECLAGQMPPGLDSGEMLARFAEARKMPKGSAFLKILAWGLPFLTLFFLLSALLGIQTRWSMVGFDVLLIVQILFALLGHRRNQAVLRPVFAFQAGVEPYRAVFALLEREPFTSAYGKELKEKLTRNGGAVQALQELESIAGAVKLRFNGLGYILCNSLLMWDYHCVGRFQEWNATHGAAMREWLETVGEIEALASLSVLCNVRERTVFPEIGGAEPSLSFDDLRHPLIPEEKAVGNGFSLRASTCVVTGSNMSGKTTFLRSIGVNLLLAYAGGPVLAERFQASELALLTSMRIEDSVSEGISTFYAELLRIKKIVEFSRTGKPMLALIDEIFKGTNSRDRILGATETIRRLSVPHALTIVTTHDFELCELENDRTIHAVNCHFSEHYVGDEIRFDYKIRPGRCKTTNAQHLLRMVGILT